MISAPECPKVYTGTFHDQPLKYDLYRVLFEEELKKLFDDLQDLPRNAALRKLNDFIKRARHCQTFKLTMKLKDNKKKYYSAKANYTWN